ncbi:MAG: hypothetical protein JWM04_1139, partial [Verrucomicrobiales bacterium]|nr:hypothetical protein [Verrucomicrobiales bacterium]
LRTLQEIFTVTPLLGNAAKCQNLEDLFTFVSIKGKLSANQLQLEFNGLGSVAQNLVVERSSDVKTWAAVATNLNAASSVTNSFPATNASEFYRAQIRP